MCLSTVYLLSGNQQKEVMKDVVRIEAEAKGFRLIDLFGGNVFVEGAVKIVDLVEGHFVVIEKELTSEQNSLASIQVGGGR